MQCDNGAPPAYLFRAYNLAEVLRAQVSDDVPQQVNACSTHTKVIYSFGKEGGTVNRVGDVGNEIGAVPRIRQITLSHR